MRIQRDPILNTWEMAESEERQRILTGRNLVPCKSGRLLIVDDEAGLRKVVSKLLKRHLPLETVDIATQGEEAVQLFSENHPNVVLMDIFMPVMDGEKAAYAILDHCEQQQWEPPGIIFLTGHDPSPGVRNMAASDPAHCLLRKPVRNQTLITAVRKRL